ncbi:uncharacterized protein LOC115923953 [Strongylocentrotus purpuratus]|uniref:Uncharacterized protein n=1 Tax=Strongylocentrotus purpuratus TaxID=7668 RepID=A0A7M7HJ78_STRPU|nr:uncharacterized protein LOC105446300 [Strongylocentrotus purpuratus]XP_030841168.1 uncharacterized protein LOC115923953 [Strongylocentrotus purpuratus]|eukprot:XP_011681224.1 PREDICTED: uncharacterized protein LOC105446300 [Strongylocentrotus purpuratus]
MSGSRHWSGVQSWLVVACLMIVVEYSTCTLLEEMDLMRHRNAEKKGGLNCRQCSVNKEYLISHMDTCKNICTRPLGKRGFEAEEEQDNNSEKNSSVKSSQCVIDPLYYALSEEGKKQVMQVLTEWL